MHGSTGKGLKVDLTARRTEVFRIPPSSYDAFIGGRGVAVSMLGKRVCHPWDDPEMALIFAAGPLVGTAAPTSGRSVVLSRSPQTGTVLDCSVGGGLGIAMKKAGLDAIEVVGRSDDWVFLSIADDRISIESARDLVGLPVSEVRSRLGGTGSTAVIGPAGENGVRFASIVVDGHFLAGRGGLGAVMGSKKLKAIRIEGSSPVAVSDPAGLAAAREEIMRLLRASPAVFGEFGLAEFGTAALVDLIHARRMEPTDNFRQTFFSSAPSYSGYHLRRRYKARKTGCGGCPILCKKLGENGEVIPEFETVSHFGALNLNRDVASIVEANRLCNEYGMDTITTAATIAFYAETDGIRSDPERIIGLIHAIGRMEKGLGEVLGLGSYLAGKAMNRPEVSMSVKGLELPAYDPRGAYGMALAYATSNRGGCHLRAYPISHEILRKPVATDRFSFEGKARTIKIAEDTNAVIDSLTACKFVFFAASLEEYAKALSAVTGQSHTTQSLLKTGERIYLLERHLNSLNGFCAADDDLPRRFFAEDGSSSSAIRIAALDREDFLAARESYYRIRGYNAQGIPDRELLVRHGLGAFI